MIKTQEKQSPQPGGIKKFIFLTILLLLPVLLLLTGEIFLRLIHYGGEVDLVLTREINGRTYCYINKKVARRFFTQQDIHIPDARSTVFLKEKSPETYRIFCLGGSTTAGFPFEYNATFPSLLQDRLDVLFPEKNVEVINVGISAINSYSVLDFTRELVHYSPDLFIVYMGHNEFYGALGIGSTQQIGQNRNWILLYMRLQKIRLFQLLRDMIGGIRNLFSEKGIQLADQTLMEKVVADRHIPLGSPKYNLALDYYEKNLEAIIQTGHQAGAKVILSTLVSNLADFEPFASEFSPDLKPIQIERWKMYLEKGKELEKNGQPNEALVEYYKAEKIDSRPAELYFRRAKCLQATLNTDIARKEYIRARDLDVLRFRASSDFNAVIQKVGQRHQVPVVDMEKIFENYCLDKILDNNLFTDHLHPTFAGYFWMAKAFCEAMWHDGCVLPKDQWNWERIKTTEEFRRLAGVTDLDLEIASQRIRKLTVHWPFKKEIVLRSNSGSPYDSLLEETVTALMKQKLGWNDAHYKIAKYLQQKGDYEGAAREYEAVLKVVPFNYFPYIELANLQMRMSKYDEAEITLKKGLNFSRHLPYIYAKLGMLLCFTRKYTPAIENLRQALVVNERAKLFKDYETAGAYYLLSLAYSQTGKIPEAREAAQTALRIKPDYGDARAILNQLSAAGY